MAAPSDATHARRDAVAALAKAGRTGVQIAGELALSESIVRKDLRWLRTHHGIVARCRNLARSRGA